MEDFDTQFEFSDDLFHLPIHCLLVSVLRLDGRKVWVLLVCLELWTKSEEPLVSWFVLYCLGRQWRYSIWFPDLRMMHKYSFSRSWVHYYIWQWDIQHWTLLLLISSSRFLPTCWRSVKRISRKTLPFSYYGLRSECFAWTALHFMRVPVLSRVLKPRFKLWVWSGCQWNLRSSDDVCNAFTWVMDENLRNFFVSRISVPSRDVMFVKYTSENK